MKILKDNKMYVQKNDMAHLNSSGLSIPASIFMQVYGKGITIIDDSNRYEFIEFSKPEDIEFFKGIDWIVDYNEVKDLTEEQLIELGQSVGDAKNEKIYKFNIMPVENRRQQYEQVTMDLELMDFKMFTIRDIIMLKRGQLSFPLPKGVELVLSPATESSEELVEIKENPKKETGVKKFIKSIFRKKQDN